MKLSAISNLGLLLTFGRGRAWIPTTKVHQKQSQVVLSAAQNNNIVLRPTEDNESAFDSLKIGGATVHRYTRDVAEGLDGESAEYVMWYHGRSVEQDKDKTLPPLSTGRIGRATSRNGLLWKKDTVGSASEDAEDCSLGLNKESWWGFDTAHVGLGNILLPVSTPAVITEGGVYLMYYMGGNFEETPIADYTDNKNIPADATIKGMNMKIGVCLSQDGKTWGRVEGDDPTGACVVPYRENDRNMQAKGDHLKEELYCGWPSVVVNISEKKSEGSGFFMYYSTMTKDEKKKCIGWADSPDGFRWTKRGICLEPEEGTMDADGCARCNVLRNAVFDDVETGTWQEAPGYTMFYEGVSKEDNKHRIMKATSDDGESWTKCGVVLDVGEADDSWDCMGVGSPNVLRMDDGSQRVYYTGQGPGGSTAIGVAKLDSDSENWVREQASITFTEA